MSKEPHHPKAVHILRPSQSYSARKTLPTTTVNTVNKGFGGPTPIKTESKKIKVAVSARIAIGNDPPLHQQPQPQRRRSVMGSRPQINSHPPSPPRPSKSQQIFPKGGRINTIVSPSRPTTFELYRPIKPASTMSKSSPDPLTGPVLSSVSTPVSVAKDRLHSLHQQRPSPVFPKSISHININIPPSVSPSSLSTASEHSDFGTDDESESDEDTAETLEEDDDDGQEVKEARVNRKIADLEISNQSLLAVNEMLEITVRRQATQVAQLRKQLGVKGPLDIKPLHLPLDNQNDDDESDTNWENDTLFSRMKQLTESMIQQGEASLRSKYKERVLSSYLTVEENEESRVGTKEPEKPSQPLPEKARRSSLPSNNNRLLQKDLEITNRYIKSGGKY